ncbi:hypothetical protein DFH09DRAFT_1312479 [Mycena vulgaris]|nr:hypothetical protein DFH09DRAFT_1312479 [Mycena vulgaris]
MPPPSTSLHPPPAARIHDAERRAPSSAELLTLHETAYGDDAGNPPGAYGGIVRPRTRSERHFSASVPPSSSHSHSCSSEHGHTSETLDGDAAPDRSAEEIWLIGVRLPRWTSEDEECVAPTTQAREGDVDEGPWPAQFHAALRAQAFLPSTASYASYNSTSTSPSAALGTHKKMWWALGGAKGWTNDAGWVCMLDTSRSLLATALQQNHPHLTPGSAPLFPPKSPIAHAAHARLVSCTSTRPPRPSASTAWRSREKPQGRIWDVVWARRSGWSPEVRFLPPFLSLHPTDIGRRTLVDAYPVCGLRVNLATDGTLYQTEVFAASPSPAALARTPGYR